MKTYDELHDELLLMDDASLAAVSNIYSVRMNMPQKMIYCMADLDDVMRKLGIAVPVKQLSSGSFSLSDEYFTFDGDECLMSFNWQRRVRDHIDDSGITQDIMEDPAAYSGYIEL